MTPIEALTCINAIGVPPSCLLQLGAQMPLRQCLLLCLLMSGWPIVIDEDSLSSAGWTEALPAELGDRCGSGADGENMAAGAQLSRQVGWQNVIESEEGPAHENESAGSSDEASALTLAGQAGSPPAEGLADPFGHGLGDLLLGQRTVKQGIAVAKLVASACRDAALVIFGGIADLAPTPQHQDGSAADEVAHQSGGLFANEVGPPMGHAADEVAPYQVGGAPDLAANQPSGFANAVASIGLAIDRASAGVARGFAALVDDDPRSASLVESWFGNTIHRATSKATAGDHARLPPEVVVTYKRSAASCVWSLGRRDLKGMLLALCREVSQADGHLLAWTEKLSADETTMPLRVFGTEACTSESLKSAVETSLRAPARTISTRVSQAAPTKVLQSARWYSCLFRVSGVHLHLQMEVVVPLQAMASTKADVYYRCFEASEYDLDLIAKQFKRRQRLSIRWG